MSGKNGRAPHSRGSRSGLAARPSPPLPASSAAPSPLGAAGGSPGDAQEQLFAQTHQLAINLVLVSQYEFRDADGFLVHREQRQDDVSGRTPEERQEAAARIVGQCELLRLRFLEAGENARQKALRYVRDLGEKIDARSEEPAP